MSKGHPLRGRTIEERTEYVSRYQIHYPLSDSQQIGDADIGIVKAAVETSHLAYYANRRRHRSPGFTASLSCKATLEESLLQIRQDNRKCQSGEHQLSEGNDRK